MDAIIPTVNAKWWQAALDRAIRNALNILVCTNGEVSTSQRDQRCQHQACSLAQMSELALQAPEGNKERIFAHIDFVMSVLCLLTLQHG